MDINKILYQGQPLIDLTNTTATANDVKQGKVFHTASGSTATGSLEVPDLSQTTATANDVAIGKKFYDSLGVLTDGLLSGGLEYEMGEYTPTEEVWQPTISYNRTHSEAPFYVFLCDSTQAVPSGNNTMRWFEYIDMYKLFGVKQDKPGGAIYYAYIIATDGYDSHGVLKLQNPSTDTTSNNKNYPRYWVDENGFRAGITSYPTLTKFLAGRTYKWIAIWK